MSEENDVIELNLDVIPFNKGDFLNNRYSFNNYHINYKVNKNDYEKNKNKIHYEICYRIKFAIETPEDIKNSDVLILIDRNTTKIIDIVIKNFINIKELKELINIENPDVVQYRLRKIFENGIEIEDDKRK